MDLVEAALVIDRALVEPPQLAQNGDELLHPHGGAAPLTPCQFSIIPAVPLPNPRMIRPPESSSRSRASAAHISGCGRRRRRCWCRSRPAACLAGDHGHRDRRGAVVELAHPHRVEAGVLGRRASAAMRSKRSGPRPALKIVTAVHSCRRRAVGGGAGLDPSRDLRGVKAPVGQGLGRVLAGQQAVDGATARRACG